MSFGSLMRESMTTGSVPFYKAYLRAFIDAVEVDDRVIRIHGSKSPPNKPLSPVIGWEPGKGVRALVRKWRSLGKSENPAKSMGCTSGAQERSLRHKAYFEHWLTE